MCPGSGGTTEVVGVRPLAVPELTFVTNSGAVVGRGHARCMNSARVPRRPTRPHRLDRRPARSPICQPRQPIPLVRRQPATPPAGLYPPTASLRLGGRQRRMSPPTWEDTHHLGAGSRYRPTPAGDSRTDRPASAATPRAQESSWPSAPDPGDRPKSHPPTSPRDPVGLVDSATSALRTLPEVLTAREAAAILRIGRNQLYQAVARGELPAIRIGRSIRIPKHALLALLASTGPLPASSDEQPRQPATQVRQGPP